MSKKNQDKTAEFSIYVSELFKVRFSALEKDKIVEEFIANQDAFNALIDYILIDSKPFNIGPSWVLSYAGVKRPQWFFYRLHDLTSILNTNTHPALYRALSRVLKLAEIPYDKTGLVIDLCMKWLENPNQSVAVKSFSIHTLSKLMVLIPELCPELKYRIESILPYSSSGIKNAGNKILKKIKEMGY